jgi:hexosaminidase
MPIGRTQRGVGILVLAVLSGCSRDQAAEQADGATAEGAGLGGAADFGSGGDLEAALAEGAADVPTDDGCTEAGDQLGPAVVPWPRRVQLCSGSMSLSAARILAASADLLPLAELLSDELAAATGLRLAAIQSDSPADGEILLRTSAAYTHDEAYLLSVHNGVLVEGRDYEAVARGTVTLLQAIAGAPSFELPHMTIADEPDVAYRGLMIDVARHPHSIATLERLVELVRLYKVRYLQLHFTDNEAFTFPSTAYPELAAGSGYAYSLADLAGLESYSQRRGVTIVPELDTPGHGGAFNAAMPGLFAIGGVSSPATIDFARPTVMQALDTLVGEMSEVFPASPYFHIGADEVDLSGADDNPDFKALLVQYGLQGADGLMQMYRKFIIDMDPIVTKRDKRMIVWEGFHHDPTSAFQIPRDTVVMSFEHSYITPEQVLADGYDDVNASWTPLYLTPNAPVWSPSDVYTWNLFQFGPAPATDAYAAVARQFHIVLPTPHVLGAQMCSWEHVESAEIPKIRAQLPVVSERIWNMSAARGFSDFDRRYQQTNRLLEKLIP